MEVNNFFVEYQYITTGLVNGLIGAIALWAIWTPAITFFIVPILSSTFRTSICQNLFYNIPTGLIPNASVNSAEVMMKDDNQQIKELNVTPTMLIWMTAGLVILIAGWCLYQVVSKSDLQVSNIVILNSMLVFFIVLIEGLFFFFLGIEANIINVQDVVDGVSADVANDLSKYTTVN